MTGCCVLGNVGIEFVNKKLIKFRKQHNVGTAVRLKSQKYRKKKLVWKEAPCLWLDTFGWKFLLQWFMFCKVCFVLITSGVESTSFHASGALLDVITNNVFREVLQAFHDKLLVTKKSRGAHLESKIMERHVKETKISGLLEKWATSYLNSLAPRVHSHAPFIGDPALPSRPGSSSNSKVLLWTHPIRYQYNVATKTNQPTNQPTNQTNKQTNKRTNKTKTNSKTKPKQRKPNQTNQPATSQGNHPRHFFEHSALPTLPTLPALPSWPCRHRCCHWRGHGRSCFPSRCWCSCSGSLRIWSFGRWFWISSNGFKRRDVQIPTEVSRKKHAGISLRLHSHDDSNWKRSMTGTSKFMFGVQGQLNGRHCELLVCHWYVRLRIFNQFASLAQRIKVGWWGFRMAAW